MDVSTSLPRTNQLAIRSRVGERGAARYAGEQQVAERLVQQRPIYQRQQHSKEEEGATAVEQAAHPDEAEVLAVERGAQHRRRLEDEEAYSST